MSHHFKSERGAAPFEYMFQVLAIFLVVTSVFVVEAGRTPNGQIVLTGIHEARSVTFVGRLVGVATEAASRIGGGTESIVGVGGPPPNPNGGGGTIEGNDDVF